MTDKDLITAFTNELTIDRTSENIGAAWLRKGAGPAAVESCAPFWFRTKTLYGANFANHSERRRNGVHFVVIVV